MTVHWFGASRSTRSTKFSRSCHRSAAISRAAYASASGSGRMVVAQETIDLLGIATDPHQIVPQELHGMVELVLRGLRKLLFGQE